MSLARHPAAGESAPSRASRALRRVPKEGMGLASPDRTGDHVPRALPVWRLRSSRLDPGEAVRKAVPVLGGHGTVGQHRLDTDPRLGLLSLTAEQHGQVGDTLRVPGMKRQALPRTMLSPDPHSPLRNVTDGLKIKQSGNSGRATSMRSSGRWSHSCRCPWSLSAFPSGCQLSDSGLCATVDVTAAA